MNRTTRIFISNLTILNKRVLVRIKWVSEIHAKFTNDLDLHELKYIRVIKIKLKRELP